MLVLLKAVAKLAVILPHRWALALGRGLGAVFGAVAGKQRRRARQQLHECFPEKSDKEIRQLSKRMFQNMGLNIIEMLRWIGGADDELKKLIAIEGEDHLRAVLAQGRGAIALVSHIGNWDMMGLWGAGQYPLTIISKDLRNEAINNYWMDVRKRSGLKIVSAHNSYRDCLRLLKRGECLGFILDQNMTRDDGIFVDFFGKPACTTPGLAVMSAHAGVPVVPYFMIRDRDGRHIVHIHPPLEPPPNRDSESIRQATQQYTKIVEDVIRQYPDQWIWMHRRWRTQPTDEDQATLEPKS